MFQTRKATVRTSPRPKSETEIAIIGDTTNSDYFFDDLSRFRTTIPRIVKDSKSECAFIICLEKSDESSEFNRHEQIRYYAEFYALENKLKEFHGQHIGCNLPTRRLVLRNEDYYLKMRPLLESWLQKLLTRPEFRHSKLILDFIRNDESGSFNSNLLESSINLNRFSQPINKIIGNKRSPHLIASLSQMAKMKYALPNKEWSVPPNSDAAFQLKSDLVVSLNNFSNAKCLVKLTSQKFRKMFYRFNSLIDLLLIDY